MVEVGHMEDLCWLHATARRLGFTSWFCVFKLCCIMDCVILCHGCLGSINLLYEKTVKNLCFQHKAYATFIRKVPKLFSGVGEL